MSVLEFEKRRQERLKLSSDLSLNKLKHFSLNWFTSRLFHLFVDLNIYSLICFSFCFKCDFYFCSDSCRGVFSGDAERCLFHGDNHTHYHMFGFGRETGIKLGWQPMTGNTCGSWMPDQTSASLSERHWIHLHSSKSLQFISSRNCSPLWWNSCSGSDPSDQLQTKSVIPHVFLLPIQNQPSDRLSDAANVSRVGGYSFKAFGQTHTSAIPSHSAESLTMKIHEIQKYFERTWNERKLYW